MLIHLVRKFEDGICFSSFSIVLVFSVVQDFDCLIFCIKNDKSDI